MQTAELPHNERPAPGSDAYYAVVFSPKTTRPPLEALFALAQHWHQLGARPKDASVAQHQLHWWLEQTALDHLSRSQHPLLRTLQTDLLCPQGHITLSAALQNMARSALNQLSQSRFLDRPALLGQLLSSHGAWAQALAVLNSSNALPPASFKRLLANAEQLGLAWGLGQVLSQCSEDARHGLVRLPVSDLQASSVRAHELIKGMTGQLTEEQRRSLKPGFERLLRSHLAWFESTLAQALAQSDPQDLAALKPLLILLALTRQSIRPAPSQFGLDGLAFPQPNPLRKFWAAWKMQALGRM